MVDFWVFATCICGLSLVVVVTILDTILLARMEHRGVRLSEAELDHASRLGGVLFIWVRRKLRGAQT
jgi:hypothetical protein